MLAVSWKAQPFRVAQKCGDSRLLYGLHSGKSILSVVYRHAENPVGSTVSLECRRNGE
jgi:hypothetical protein